MWFATPNGLSALANDRWISYAPRDGLPSDNVNCLFEDSAGVLWVGTAAGLAFRGWPVFKPSSKLSRNPCTSRFLASPKTATDRSGSQLRITCCVSTATKLMRGVLAEGDIREFGLADGLRGVEGVKRQQSVVADPLGQIWFSMNRGISVVDPARLNRNDVPVIAHIQSVAADNVPVDMSSAIAYSIAASQRITFDFAGSISRSRSRSLSIQAGWLRSRLE